MFLVIYRSIKIGIRHDKFSSFYCKHSLNIQIFYYFHSSILFYFQASFFTNLIDIKVDWAINCIFINIPKFLFDNMISPCHNHSQTFIEFSFFRFKAFKAHIFQVLNHICFFKNYTNQLVLPLVFAHNLEFCF